VDSLALEKGEPMDELMLLYSRALDLLSRSSVYVPRDLKNEIVKLARDGGRAGVPVRVERAGGMVIIDPWKVVGKGTPAGSEAAGNSQNPGAGPAG
jgi:hypothetical protein